MIIANAAIQLSSERSFTQKYEKSESLRIQTGQGQAESGPLVSALPSSRQDLIDLSNNLLEDSTSHVDGESSSINAVDSELGLFKLLMEKLLKKKIDVKEFGATEPGTSKSKGLHLGQGREPNFVENPTQAGFGLAYDYHESTYEAESTSFSAQGVVETKDGRKVEFNLDLEMSREFYSEENVSIRMGTLVDPIVLNFNGDTAALTDTKFDFDLDSDGDDEQISFLSSHSGFLAFDRNSDGTINDGSELFGPSSGDGFAELAAYDEDGNQFIDEGDSIYNSLSLYNKNADGDDVMISLKDRNVGAIYLGNVNTQFSLNDQQNQTHGQVRTSSVFIEEDGGVGTVQQLDLSA